MNTDHMAYQALPFPMERQVTIQGGRLASRFTQCFKELIEGSYGLMDLVAESPFH